MRNRERQRHRQRKKQVLCGEPDAGLNSRTQGSCPEPKADAQPLSHPGIPRMVCIFKMKMYSWSVEISVLMAFRNMRIIDDEFYLGCIHGWADGSEAILGRFSVYVCTVIPPWPPLDLWQLCLSQALGVGWEGVERIRAWDVKRFRWWSQYHHVPAEAFSCLFNGSIHWVL